MFSHNSGRRPTLRTGAQVGFQPDGLRRHSGVSAKSSMPRCKHPRAFSSPGSFNNPGPCNGPDRSNNREHFKTRE